MASWKDGILSKGTDERKARESVLYCLPMQPATALLWWFLNVLTLKRYEALKAVYGDLDAALKDLSPAMLKELGLKQDAIEAAFVRLEEFDAAQYLAQMAKYGVELLTIEDEAYPSPLKESGDPPLFLSYRGNITLFHQPLIGCVGTRAMSPYGKRTVEAFIPALVRAGLTTVSGLALGIDALVAKETIRAGGRTIAVLGNGLGSIYPASNAKLAQEILESGGVIVSEFPLDMPPGKFTFPARNRIIAGLSTGTIVFEAPEASGSIITADLALEYNRDVFAVPGTIFDPNFAGCHRLISKGHARLVTRPEDVLEELGVVTPAKSPVSAAQKNAEEQHIYSILTTMPQSVDKLIERAERSMAQVSSTLTMLELSGSAKKVGVGEWVRA